MIATKIELNPHKIVLVLGGHGFIGSHIVEQLDNLGAYTFVGTRGQRRPRQVGERIVALHTLSAQTDWDALLEDVDVVINAVGILRQRCFETYEQVHHLAVAKLVSVCAERSIRFVHISALGLRAPIHSRFSISKRRGEDAIKASAADWYIVRPSLVDGEGGFGAKWMHRIANWVVHFVPTNANGLFAPIDVKDLGEAVARIALMAHVPGGPDEREIELGGPKNMNLMDYLTCLSHRAPLARVKVPAVFVRLCSHLFDALHITPLSFGHYELLQYDNYPKCNRLASLLGRAPKIIGPRSPASTETVGRNESRVREFS